MAYGSSAAAPTPSTSSARLSLLAVAALGLAAFAYTANDYSFGTTSVQNKQMRTDAGDAAVSFTSGFESPVSFASGFVTLNGTSAIAEKQSTAVTVDAAENVLRSWGTQMAIYEAGKQKITQLRAQLASVGGVGIRDAEKTDQNTCCEFNVLHFLLILAKAM